MAAIIRFFSRRFGRKKTEPAPSQVEEILSVNKTKKNKKSDLECRVTYLDDTEQTFYLPKNADASELFDLAFAYVGLIEERDYFSLKCRMKNQFWLDRTKEIRKQCKVNPPYSFMMRVKFYSSDPHHLHDEYTRYLVVLQLRDDIRSGRLSLTDFQLAAELAALSLQAEFGDFDKRQHTPVFVSTFRFLPEQQQTEPFEASVLSEYRSLCNRNLNPADAESLYLEKARHIPDYGVDMHQVLGKNNEEYRLGLTPTGILVYEGSKKIGLFFWPNIMKIEFNGCRLKIVVTDEDEATRKVTDHTFCFVLPDKHACKNLWKSAVEHHAFFRFTNRIEPPPKRFSFFRLGSRFRASANTEFQMGRSNLFGSSSFRRRKKNASAPPTPILATKSSSSAAEPGSLMSATVAKATSFRRVPSKRFTARRTFSNRTSFEERRARRHRIPPSQEQMNANVFDQARAVVDVERACVRDRAWTPPREFPSPTSKSPSLRNRAPPSPVIKPATDAHSVPQAAVRISPKSKEKPTSNLPLKPPRSINGIRQTEGSACFEATV